MITITPSIALPKSEIEETFIRSPGPGGQHVNKTESAVQLRFNARKSESLTNAVYLRLKTLAGRRMTRAGVIVITANRFRSQERNRGDALDRLVDLIRRAAVAPKPRRVTKPGRGAKQKRLDAKHKRSDIKKSRGKPGPQD
ncbi:MAG TPA: alternative ribosome rescue aminoacyl-tRNA hydrolase ArfB [Rhodospirillales bacterium]|jgi:ribosome-associated protein|nr:alternative ribosome rescue aminoacyl-tRNA hydrolase ArfB [Rhodospirillales bacterium]